MDNIIKVVFTNGEELEVTTGDFFTIQNSPLGLINLEGGNKVINTNNINYLQRG